MNDNPEPRRRGRKRKTERKFDHQYTLRIRTADRDRFDDYVHRHRILVGEALNRMLDPAEAMEGVNKAFDLQPPKP